MQLYLLLNATAVNQQEAPLYEFILSGPTFLVNECYYVKNQGLRQIEPVPYPFHTINKMLFEINHLRIDPQTHPKSVLAFFEQHLKKMGGILPPSCNQTHCWLWPADFKLRFKLELERNLSFIWPSHFLLNRLNNSCI
jgi:hypothetical protein